MIVLCFGSRSWNDYDLVEQAMLDHLEDGDTVLHGDARGADSICGEVATDLGYDVQAMPANWDRDGRAAGYIRNRAMVAREPRLALGFWDGQSAGTAHTYGLCVDAGIPVYCINPHGQRLTSMGDVRL